MIDVSQMPPVPVKIADLRAYVHWQHPKSKRHLCMHPDSIQALARRSLSHLKSPRPSELGGVLWGKFLQREEGACLVLIPELVASEAPLFNSTEKDSKRLVAALEQAPPPGLRLIGLFRSHLREGLCLTTDDESIIGRYFGDPDSVFLIIRPFEIGICMAGFFFWEHGVLQTDASELEIPFVASDMGSVQEDPQCKMPDTSARQIATVPDVPREYPQTLNSPPAVPLRQPRPRFGWALILTPTFVLLTIACAYALVMKARFYPPPSPIASRTQVGLQVKLSPNGQMDLSWDQTSPDLQKAQSAKLTILDGTLHREVNVDKSQLRFGKISYFPNSDDVQFLLEVHLDAARSISESVRVLPKLGGAPAVLNISSADSRRPAAATISSGTSIRASAQTSKQLPLELVTTPKVPEATLLPSQSLGSLSPPPTLISSSSVTNPTPNLRLAPAPLPPPPSAEAPSTTPATVPTDTPSAYVPPAPIRQVAPAASQDLSVRTSEAASVTVHLKISREGRVEKATVMQAVGVSAATIMQATTAAKQWQFRPATLHGKSIPSDHTIVFRFRPQG